MEQHNTAMQSLCEKLEKQMVSQAELTERQIKQQFEKLHQFLRDEEKATIAALRKSKTIKDKEKFPVSLKRDSEGDCLNMPFRVLTRVQVIIPYTPVTLDPNTAHPCLIVSHSRTRVRYTENEQPLPDNPERFDIFPCVLGSEGFHSGKHFWEVEVRESLNWCLGVTTASNQRKGCDFFYNNVWCVQNRMSVWFSFDVERDLDRVRVDLDYDGGTVSFSDPVTNTHVHTFKTTFTDTVLPFFCCSSSLRILPLNTE